MAKPISAAALDTIFRQARTYNGYQNKPVTEEHIRKIYDLLKMGPTSANQHPGRFVWCLSQDAKDKLAECAGGANPPKIKAAPAAVVIGMDPDFHEHLPWLFPHADAKSWFDGDAEHRMEHAFRNSSLQGAYFIIAARAIGLDTGPMSGFDADKVNAEFFAGTNYKVNFISTLGYGDPETIFDRSPRPAFEKFNAVI